MDYHDILRIRLCRYVKEHKCEDTKPWDNSGNVHYFIAKRIMNSSLLMLLY